MLFTEIKNIYSILIAIWESGTASIAMMGSRRTKILKIDLSFHYEGFSLTSSYGESTPV